MLWDSLSFGFGRGLGLAILGLVGLAAGGLVGLAGGLFLGDVRPRTPLAFHAESLGLVLGAEHHVTTLAVSAVVAKALREKKEI